MSIDLGKLDAAIAKANKEVTDTAHAVLKKVAIQVDQALVLATPVDKGRAQNNWLPSLNVPVGSPRLDVKGSGAPSIAEAIGVVNGAKLGDIVYFSNNLPYIGVLNDGHSNQAPAGFVQKATLAAQSSLTGLKNGI